ncbi:hypothetical protein, partial [Legionella erythra]
IVRQWLPLVSIIILHRPAGQWMDARLRGQDIRKETLALVRHPTVFAFCLRAKRQEIIALPEQDPTGRAYGSL